MKGMAALAILAVLFLVFGVAALAYSLSLDAAARDFKSATPCRTGVQNSDCYERRTITITSTGTGRYGEVNTVDFLDRGRAHEVMLHPGGQDTSVLQTGASGVAILWRGTYTTIEIGGLSFVTDDNPVGQQGLWSLFAYLGILCGLVVGATWAWTVRRQPKPTPIVSQTTA